jgi:hypothetical protein
MSRYSEGRPAAASDAGVAEAALSFWVVANFFFMTFVCLTQVCSKPRVPYMMKIEKAVLQEKLESIDLQLREESGKTPFAATQGPQDANEKLLQERMHAEMALLNLQNKLASAAAAHDVLSSCAPATNRRSARYVLIL